MAQHHPTAVDPELQRIKEKYKTRMRHKFVSHLERYDSENNPILKRGYEEIGHEKGNDEHELLQVEETLGTQRSQGMPIKCEDLFKASEEAGHEEKNQVKTVLTKGVAGIGKTVSVQKFILDWAEGKENQDVDFMIELPFREMNLVRSNQYSLQKLMQDFHPELRDLDSKMFEQCKVMLIFDGLDESRITLSFSEADKVSDMSQFSSVGLLITNLLKGDLFPSSLIWITSRPTAAHQIPWKYISRLTEIQGFNDSQKEEYFRRRIGDEDQAKKINSLIRRTRSLHSMCHIPVFCCIAATVLQKLLEEDPKVEVPLTLTEIYIHFIRVQINVRNQVFELKDTKELKESNRETIVKLAEVAFKQLIKGNVIIYEEDLIESGLNVTEVSVLSKIHTGVFKEEESVIHQRNVYSFSHLSVQEFLAAFFVFDSYLNKNTELLKSFLDVEDKGCRNKTRMHRPKKYSLFLLLSTVLEKTLGTENGHLDLFLRFLIGITLESNQTLLEDLLIDTEDNANIIKAFDGHVKRKITGFNYFSPSKSINLFLCLLEMKDQTLSREIEEFVKSDRCAWNQFSAVYCSAIAYVIKTLEEGPDELDLMKYGICVEERLRLIPAVVNCRKATLAGYSVTDKHCDGLSLALQSSNSCLRELDLSNNELQDSGVILLCTGLKSSHCRLNTLRLVGCRLSTQCCESLSSALTSPNSSIRELDLSNNDLQDSGVMLLSAGLKSSHCQLDTLRVIFCNLTGQSSESLASVLQSSNSHLTELDLSNNDLQDSGVELLSAGLRSLHCRLNTLRLSGCMVTEEGCRHLASALSANPHHLRELDLSYNHPGDLGIQLLSQKLEDSSCVLNQVNLDHGGELRITAGLYKYFCHLTLDPNTASPQLHLFEGMRTATYMQEKEVYPDHPDRFDGVPQVLCQEPLTGRCYWEAEWHGETDIAVSYKRINRKGKKEECIGGFNANSWCLICFEERFDLWHNHLAFNKGLPPDCCKRVGVYVDTSAGFISFYRISDGHVFTHIHTFNSTFTDALYAGFGFLVHPYNSSVSLCQAKSC